MPSLRKRVSSYFRQLSFHNEPRERRSNVNENAFVTKYLQGLIKLREGPAVLSGKAPTDLPNYDLDTYKMGSESIIGCYTGPNGGLTTVKRTEKHLCIPGVDIDFIDTQDDIVPHESKSKLKKEKVHLGLPIDNTTMIIKVAGQEYFVTNRKKQKKSQSLDSLSECNIEAEAQNNNNNNIKSLNEVQGFKNTETVNSRRPSRQSIVSANKCSEQVRRRSGSNRSNASTKKVVSISKNDERRSETGSSKRSFELAKSKSEGNPFQHKKKGKIIRIDRRPTSTVSSGSTTSDFSPVPNLDLLLPDDWSKHSEHVFGLSDSLYDRNLVTKSRNGDPIADCFGVVARKDSAVLAVADGVNWGEKACIAAKSAVHGCLHYLNKTIFNDLKPFENLVKTDSKDVKCETPLHETHMTNTQEVFVCLLRAFNCAHDLILENNGMLTTLTVAVILPLKDSSARKTLSEDGSPTNDESFVCCVCNVGDTLAYVYSHKYGIRELTKGSHDVQSNRDMRDALGALGPVDGTNPELSNLTLSVTKIQKGDLVIVASDGLTDNFDPNVCKFSVNATVSQPVKPNRESKVQTQSGHGVQVLRTERRIYQAENRNEKLTERSKPPIKPPRRNYVKGKDNISRSSTERSSRSQSVESKGKVNTSKDVVDNVRRKNEGLKNSEGDRKEIGKESNPLISHFLRENSVDDDNSLQKSRQTLQSGQQKSHPLTRTLSMTEKEENQKRAYNFLRSKTSVELRTKHTVHRNPDGIPYVTPIQRYELTLLLMEDILKNGISGRESRCVTARKLCENLMSFTFSITSAKRRTLEDNEMYFDNQNGVLVEVSNMEKKVRRKKGLERVQHLPGKLDHVTVVAFNVGDFAHSI